jgi:ABC-type transport system substrate-binding protein
VAEHKELAEYLQKKWGEAGVICEIEINQAPAHQESVDNGRTSFFMKSWLGDYPDAENYLALFYSKNFPRLALIKRTLKMPATISFTSRPNWNKIWKNAGNYTRKWIK